jgi:RHS repeat-associated protein
MAKGPARRRMQSGRSWVRVARLPAAILVLVLLLCSGIAWAGGDAPTIPQGSSEVAPSPTLGSAEASQGLEITADRTATSQTFLLQDGSKETRVFTELVNYRNSRGQWTPIEEGLEQSEGAITNGPNAFELRLPNELGSGAERLSIGRQWVSAKLMGASTRPAEVEGDTATYEAAGSGPTFELLSTATGVKENIELENASQPSDFRYELSASSSVEPSLEEDGSVAFRQADGGLVALLPAPTISDGAPGSTQSSHAVSYKLTALPEGAWELAVETDRAWLEAPARVWPVTIDPSIEAKASTGSNACQYFVKEPSGETNSAPACGSTGTTELKAEFSKNGTATSRYRSALRFSVPTIGSGHSVIPANSWIESASVNLYDPQAATAIGAVQLRRATREWETSLNWPNWFNPPPGGHASPMPWTNPGGDFTNEGSELSTSERGTGAGWWQFKEGMAPLVSGWLHGTIANQGLVVKLADESACESTCTHGTFSFDSSSATPEADRPYLSVKYFPPAPLTSKVVSPTEGTRTARRLKLKSKWTTAGVEGVTYQYREGKTGEFQTIPAELVRNAEGKAVSWPEPVVFGQRETVPLFFDAAHATPALRKKGGVVQVRALFEGPTGTAGYSAPVEANVNRFLGGAKDATAAVGPGSVDLLTGNLSISHTDVSVPGFNSSLEFSRTLNSRSLAPKGSTEEAEEDESALGSGWKPGVPVEEVGGSQWRNLKIVEEKGSYEEEIGEEEIVVREYSFAYALLTDLEGGELAFEKTPSGYVAPPEVSGWTLAAEGADLVLTDPGHNRTTFSNLGNGSEYLPTAISQTGGSGNATRVEYELKEGKKRVHMVVAPSAPGVSCTSQAEATTNAGCHALIFTYENAVHWGAPGSDGERLSKITYYGGNHFFAIVAEYNYNSEGRLIEEWDPRVSPPLKEKYSYEAGGQLKTITPPGQEPWTMHYGTVDEEEGNGRLLSVTRPSLLASPSTAQTTIAYEVPLSGAGAPYEMGLSSISQWGQTDVPVDATAVFPPDQVPSSPPSSYSHASIYYMDAVGHEVNTATPSGAGTSNPSISTAENDEFGNVVRELTPQNRLRVLEKAPEARKSRWEELETKRLFGAEGTQLEEEIGPVHQVRLESGSAVQGRFHKVLQYEDEKQAGKVLTPNPHLPTRETTGAWVAGVLHDERVTETKYNWNLRKPIETVVDPGERPSHLNIQTVTVYDEATGLPIETRQPSNPSGGGAGTTKTVYYTPSGLGECENSAYVGLPCKVLPAAQTSGGTERPELLVKKYLAYNALAEPTEVSESPGGGTENVRRATFTYDAAGRPITAKIAGGGTPVPKTRTTYSLTTGMPTKQEFVCETECAGFKTQATTTTYDALGRSIKYEDADGNKSETTYDVDGRPVTMTDNRGSQAITYDPASGLPTKLEDSAAGTFTASYDADGNLVERGLPNGLTAKTSYNEADEPIKLTYTKTSFCGESCTWLEETVERSVYGQILTNTGNLVSDQYSYDKVGRLTQAQETPHGGSCTTRVYAYDLDSNRTEMTTREPGMSGACATSGGTLRKYTYDAADRLEGVGLTYDGFGRITSLPAVDAGGKALTTTYYGTDMVASQTRGSITNSYELDASLRQRSRLQGGGGLEGVEAFHYDSSSDAVAWSERGTTWIRDITGIGGELAAVQESGPAGVTLELTDLHGDVVATAEPNSTATKLKATFRYDEFGSPISGSAGRFGWLGGKTRPTELASGVIQMGVRSYVPSLGRFLTPDPVPGGSANPYDYANQDPVNGLDLGGTCSNKKTCAAATKAKAVNNVRRAVAHAKNVEQQVRSIVKAVRTPLISIVPPIHLPYEQAINSAIETAQNVLNSIGGQSCKHAAGIAGAGAALAFGTGEAAGTVPEAGWLTKAAVSGIGKALAGLGGALTVAHETGVC